MDVETSIEQVRESSCARDSATQVSGDGRTHRLLFDSAAVFIDFRDWQDDSVVITVHSPVLQDIDPEGRAPRTR